MGLARQPHSAAEAMLCEKWSREARASHFLDMAHGLDVQYTSLSSPPVA